MIAAIPLTTLAHFLVTFGLGVRIVTRKLSVQTTLAWIIIIGVFPIIGVILYFLFGDHRLGRKRLKMGPQIRDFFQRSYNINSDDSEELDLDVSPYFTDLSTVIAKETGFFPSTGNTNTLYSTADEFFDALIRDISSAKETCFLEFYIIEPEGRVEEVLGALRDAAERGVDCKIVADDFGSKPLFRSDWPGRLEEAGVQVVRSLPVGGLKAFSQRTDLRNHRKIIVVDQKIGYIGSFNLVDPKYFKQDNNVGAWVDIMLRTQGRVVSSLATVFNTDFVFDRYGDDFDKHDLLELPQYVKSKDHARDAVFQLIPSGPEMRDSLIYEIVVAAIFGARERITIVTPYFVPDEAIILALRNAAKRGLKVEIVLPKRVDSRLARYASQSNFGTLMDAGAHIYQYVAGMLHTKLFLIDDEIVMLGTVNVDMRSFYLNLEVTLAGHDRRLMQDLRGLTNDYIEQSEEIDAKTWAKRSWVCRAKENVFRLATPLL